MTARSPPVGPSRLRPTPEIVAIASMRPSSIAPESPMKILAGWKFHGRKPIAAPPAMADRTAAVDASTSPPGERTMYAKNEPAAIATIPAARPSRPSMRLTAFTIATIHRIVSGTARSGEFEITPRPGK